MQKFLITGNQRTGTTLMQILMESFKNTYVFPEERSPFVPLGPNEKSKPILVRKCPLGQQIDQEKRHLGDFKNGNVIATLDDVINAGWKIIYMVRDGRDTLVSRHGNNLNIYWARPWQYIASHDNSKIIKDNKNVLFVKYEDLVLNHKSIISKVENFVGTKAPNYMESHKNINPASQAGKAVRDPRPIDSNSIGAWKRSEHKDRIKEIISDDLCRILIELGYEQDNSWTKEYI